MPSARSFISIPTLRARPRLGAGRQHQAAARHRPAVGRQRRPGFHARHTAIRRIYRYCILNRSARSALQRTRAAWIHRPLDAEAMHAAAQALIGEHDFSAFRSVECQSKTTVRRVEADRGAARGRLSVAGDRRQRLPAPHGAQHRGHAARRAARGGPGAPPCSRCWRAAIAASPAPRRRLAGLYLWRVEYPQIYAHP